MVHVVEGGGGRGLERIYRQIEGQRIKNDTEHFFGMFYCVLCYSALLLLYCFI